MDVLIILIIIIGGAITRWIREGRKIDEESRKNDKQGDD